MARNPRRGAQLGALAIVAVLAAGAVVALASANSGGKARSAKPSALATPPRRAAGTVDALGAGAGASTPAQPAGGPEALGGAPLPLPAARIVKTGEITVQLGRGRLDAAYERVLGVVQAAGGFVASTQQSRGRASLTLRVPSAAFEQTVASVRRVGRVTDESVSGNDVTQQSVDLDARLRNWRAQEAVFLSLMNEAKTIADTITIQQQLSQIQQQIEELEGQQRVLDDQVIYSTLTVQLTEPGTAAPGPAETSSTLARAWDRASRAALAVLGGSLVVLGVVVPLALVLAPLGLGGWTLIRRRRTPSTRRVGEAQTPVTARG